MGHDAVAGGVDVGEARLHQPVHPQRTPRAGRDPGRFAERGVGPDADDNQRDVGGGAEAGSPTIASWAPSSSIAVTVTPFRTATPFRSSSSRTRAPSSGSTVGRTFGSCSTTVTASPRVRKASAISSADVPGADDDRALGPPRQRFVQREAVADRVQLKDTLAIETRNRRTDRFGSRRDEQLVVAELVLPAVGIRRRDRVRACVDRPGRVLQEQLDSGALELFGRSVRERAPVGNVAGEEVRQAADGEVRIAVCEEHGDVDAGIELACPKGGGDAGVAAADDHQAAQRASETATVGSPRMNW